MAIAPRLELRQTQALVMTPQLQQAIKLLQLSNLELHTYVEQELERNPLLERDETETVTGEAADTGETTESGSGDADADGDALATLDITEDNPPAPEAESALDTGYEDLYDGEAPSSPDSAAAPEGGSYDSYISGSGGSASFDGGEYNLENTLSSDATLQDMLTAQLHMAVADPVDRMIGGYLIDLVDEAGYLTDTVEAIAERLGSEPERVAAVLQQLQSFEPTGVFARDLAECLALQLKELDRFDPAMQALLENLDLLAKRDFAALKKLCGVDAEDLSDMVHEIQALNPKPGLLYHSEVTHAIVPDVFVRQGNDGGWVVELNSDTLPKVLINSQYMTRVNGDARSKEDKTYLSDCMTSANWLVKSLDQRANTILKVATEIVRQQDSFLVHGVEHLRPLNLKMIADAISMHESTVSRVTTNKYMATPRGITELKYFFTSAISSVDDGGSHSAEAVRHRIKTLIDAEPPDAILSDDRIVELLKEQGIDIARRTVAKYREAMRIPSSVQRRRMKKLMT